MSRVRQKGTRAERIVAAILVAMGARYRLNVRSLPGSPDFANKTRKWAVFVHGCFWHQHPACPRATIPKTNREFWRQKFRANAARDERAIEALKISGYRVALIWECEAENPALVRGRLSEVLEPSRIDMPEAIYHRGVIV